MLEILEIEKGLHYYSFFDEKFKFNNITINLIVELNEKDAALNFVLSSVLRQSSNRYKTNIELGEKLRSLYGADFFCDVKKAGNRQIISFGIEVLDDEFSLENEELLKEAVEFLEDMIFNPKIDGNRFYKEDVEIEKNDIINLVKSTYSDKKQYALKEAMKTLFEDDVFCVEKFGSLDALKMVDEEALFRAYQNLLRNSEMLVSFVGHKEKKGILDRIFNRFSNLKKEGFSEIKQKNQYFFESLKEKEEKDKLIQAKLVVAFSKKEGFCDEEEEIAIEVMNCLFGGAPTSLLFTNVREKESLCYYCRSFYNRYYGVIFVESGVEKRNVKKAYEKIVLQLERIEKGDFEEEDLKKVKNTLEGLYERVFDNEERISSYVLSSFLKNENFLPDERFSKVEKITKEAVVEVAKKFTVSLKYVLEGEDEE